MKGVGNITLVAIGRPIEKIVEPAKESLFLLMMPFGNGFEQSGAQSRRKSQRQKSGKQNRDRHRDSKLPINHSHGTRHEGQRQKDNRQHSGDPNDSTGNLRHGLGGGLDR